MARRSLRLRWTRRPSGLARLEINRDEIEQLSDRGEEVIEDEEDVAPLRVAKGPRSDGFDSPGFRDGGFEEAPQKLLVPAADYILGPEAVELVLKQAEVLSNGWAMV